MRRAVLTSFLSCALLSLPPRAGAQAAQVAPPAAAADVQQPTTPAPATTAPPPGQLAPPPVAQPLPYPQQFDPRLASHYELLVLEREITRLRASRPRMFWPVALVGVGGTLAVTSGAMALAMWTSSRTRRYGWDEQGNRYEYTYTDPALRSDLRVTVGYSVLGLALFTGGLALLIPRIRKRREIAEQARPMKQRRLELLDPARYALHVGPQSFSLSAKFTL